MIIYDTCYLLLLSIIFFANMLLLIYSYQYITCVEHTCITLNSQLLSCQIVLTTCFKRAQGISHYGSCCILYNTLVICFIVVHLQVMFTYMTTTLCLYDNCLDVGCSCNMRVPYLHMSKQLPEQSCICTRQCANKTDLVIKSTRYKYKDIYEED